MSDTFVGADLVDLDNSSTSFRGFGDSARTSGTTVVTVARRAVGNIEAETNTAEGQIIDALESMKSSMTAANTGLQGANYRGRNADVARDASADMDQRVNQAVAEVTEAFNQFRTRISALNGEIEGIATEFDRYAVAAGESGDSMGRGLDTQRTNLDTVMNSGFSAG